MTKNDDFGSSNLLYSCFSINSVKSRGIRNLAIMLKQILAIGVGLVFSAGILAEDLELKKDHPDTYVVQKGDTLWGISGKFLTKPWLWPEIWHANPQVANPHLIYPGDTLSLVYIDGQPRLVLGHEDGKLKPKVRAEQLEGSLSALPLSHVLPFLEKTRVFDQGELEKMPYVVALEENRLRGTSGQVAYVRGLNAKSGSKVLFLRPTQEFREVPVRVPRQETQRRVDARSVSEDKDFTKPNWYWAYTLNHSFREQTEHLGTEALEIARGEILREGNPATVLIQNSDTEIRKSDRVITSGSMPFDLTFYPHAAKSTPDNLRVVAFTEALNSIGPREVVALSKGERDGLEVGQVYAVYQPGEMIHDDVKYPGTHWRNTLTPSKTKVQLPEEFVGHVMVFRTFDKLSYALMMDGIRPIKLYDVLRDPAN
jgi:hypothetical protein